MPEALLLHTAPDMALQIKNSPTIKSLMKGWTDTTDSLAFVGEGKVIPSVLSLEQLLLVYQKSQAPNEEEMKSLRQYLANRQIWEASDLLNAKGNWKRPEEIANSIHSTRGKGTIDFQKMHNKFLSKVETINERLEESKGWKWISEKKPSQGWMHPNSVWHQRLKEPRVNNHKLNNRWRQQGTPTNWQNYWKTLWRGWAFPNTRIYLWRILQHGFHNNH